MKHILWTNPETGILAVTTPVPWSRLVAKIGKTEVDPPVPLDHASKVRTPEQYAEVAPGCKWAETEKAFLARVAAKAIPPGVPYFVVTDATVRKIPSFAEKPDRTFRNGVRMDAKGKPYHCMTTCRGMHMNRIRAARNAALAALDVETMRALGRGDNAARDAVEVRKQALRDLPAATDLEACKTIDDLKAVWPDGLPPLP